MDSEKVILKWNNFENICPSAFRQLWEDQDFADVTLATEDGHQIRAHKIILSSCSSFFRQLIKKNGHANLLVYLKGIQLCHLKPLMQYIYQGHCNILEEDLTLFLETGKELKIEGLIADLNMCEENESEKTISVDEDNIESNKFTETEEPTTGTGNKEPKEDTENAETTENRIIDVNIKEEPKYIINDLKTIQGKNIKKKGLKKSKKKSKKNMYYCHMCEYKSGFTNGLQYHIESKHQGIKYDCEQCGHKASSKSGLKNHTALHEVLKYDCDLCEFKAATKPTLKHHKDLVHAGITYDCEKCNVKSSSQASLKNHKDTVHDGVAYKCQLCSFTALYKGGLKYHEESQHEGIRYNCNQCSTTFTSKPGLKHHQENCN